MNLYSIILGLFVATGLGTVVWGGLSWRQSRWQAQWSVVEGKIISSRVASQQDDLLPDIRFCYTVEGRQYEAALQFPTGTTPIPEFADQYVKKYPQGSTVQVYVDVARPHAATLEPDQGGGQALMIGIGVLMAGIGVGALLFRV